MKTTIVDNRLEYMNKELVRLFDTDAEDVRDFLFIRGEVYREPRLNLRKLKVQWYKETQDKKEHPITTASWADVRAEVQRWCEKYPEAE